MGRKTENNSAAQWVRTGRKPILFFIDRKEEENNAQRVLVSQLEMFNESLITFHRKK